MSVLIPLLLTQAIVGGQGQTSIGSAQLDGYYNARREVTFSGTVAGKTKGRAPGYAQGMSILVRTGKTLRDVELGPAWYVGRQQAAIKLGDKVTVKGVPLALGKEKVFLARQIRRGRQILALRDTTGMPYWSARRERVAVSGNNAGGSAMTMGNMYQGTVGNMTTFTVNGEEYAGYVMNTPDGPVNVALAPTWYWNQQPSYFNAGDTVTLYGNGPSSRVGGQNSLGGLGGVVLVNSLNYNGGSLVLRPGGVPVYGGFYNGGTSGGNVIRP